MNLQECIDEMDAIHEAGHAVIAILCGATVSYAQLSDNANCVCRNKSNNELFVTIAGVGAELIHSSMTDWTFLFKSAGRADYKQAKSISTREELKVAKSRVIELLKENWSWVLAVANKLQEKRFIDGKTICDCIEQEA